MRPLEERIREALQASAGRPVSHHDMDAAEARFRSRQMVSAQRPHGALVTVAVAVMVAAVLGWWLGRPGADRLGPTNQPAPSLPAQTQSPTEDRVGFVGPPPPGTPPTGPATGELVAEVNLYNSGTWVYADGRIINVWRNPSHHQFRGFVVRQLTPSGVEAMRSFVVDGTSHLTPISEHDAREMDYGYVLVRDGGQLMHAQNFNGCEPYTGTWNGIVCPGFTDPDWLPANAWEDPTYRPFIPATFAVGLDEKTDATVLPATVADIFLASPRRGTATDWDSRVVATADARTMLDALEEAVGEESMPTPPSQGGNSLWFNLESLGGGGDMVFSPILPHGEGFCDCG